MPILIQCSKRSSATYTYNNGQPWRQQHSFNTSQTSALGSWTSSSTGLAAAVRWSPAIVTNSRAYLLGGQNSSGNSISTVQYATINSSGVLGTWSNSFTESLPASVCAGQVVITKDRVYYLGGYTTSASSTVYTAPINSDGTIGTWTTGNSLATAVCHSQVVITKNRIYLLGGSTGLSSGAVSTVQTATIDSNGLIGTWSNYSNSLYAALYLSSLIQTDNYVYLAGGNAGISTIYVASINTDGTLGSWSIDSTSLPGTFYEHQAVVSNTKTYVFGKSGALTLYYTTIASNDTLSSWSTGTSLASNQRDATALITSSRLYLLGGQTSENTVARVSYVAFSGGSNNYMSYTYSTT